MILNNRKCRVLMVGPAPEVMGGISAVVQSYLTSTLVERIDLKYLTTHLDGTRLKKLTIGIKAYLQFPFLCLSFRPDLVHIHFSSHVSFYRKTIIIMLAKLCGIKVIGHCNASSFDKFYDSNSLNRFFIRVFLNALDVILVVSKSWKILFESYSDNKNISILYNLVDYGAFQHNRPWEHKAPIKTVLFMGRLGQRKGTYDILNAIPAIVANYPRVRFVLAGDGDLEKVRDLVEQLGIREYVELPGWIKGADKYSYFADADLYLLPSYNEGIPVSILEAMAAGLPIIATPVNGIPDAVEDGVNGYLVNPGDVAAITDRILYMLTNPSETMEMGLRNKAKIRDRFDKSIIIEQLIDTYHSCCGAN